MSVHHKHTVFIKSTFRSFSSWLYLLNFLPVSFDFHVFLYFFFFRGYERALLLTFWRMCFGKLAETILAAIVASTLNLCRNGHVGVRQVSTGMQSLCTRVCVHILGCECVCVGSSVCINGFTEGDIKSFGWGRCLYRTGLLMTNDLNVRLCCRHTLPLPDVHSHMCHKLTI